MHCYQALYRAVKLFPKSVNTRVLVRMTAQIKPYISKGSMVDGYSLFPDKLKCLAPFFPLIVGTFKCVRFILV